MFSCVQSLNYAGSFREWKQLLLLYVFLSLYVTFSRHKLSSIVSSCFALDKFFTSSLSHLIFLYELLDVWFNSTKFRNIVHKFLDAVEKTNIGQSFSLYTRALCIFTSQVLLISSVLSTSFLYGNYKHPPLSNLRFSQQRTRRKLIIGCDAVKSGIFVPI